MQKKIIALAVAGLVSGAAFAQVAPNNVTLSGIVDMGYQYSSDSYKDGVGAQHAFNDGGQDGSRLKLDGTEDLGNGLKVGFHTDFRFAVDKRAGVTVDNQNLFLTGNFGTVTAGSFGDALDDNNGLSEAGGMGWGNGVVGQFMGSGAMKNGVKYTSPNMSGFEFMAGVSTQNKDAGEVEGDGNQRAIQARVTYVNGPIKAGLAARRDKVQGSNDRRTEWLGNGSYNFGPVILGAGYVRSTYSQGGIADADASGVAEADAVAAGFHLDPILGVVPNVVTPGFDVSMKRRTAYRLNIGAPIGANDFVAFSYSHATQKYFDDVSTDKLSGYGLSYNHNLSKRTNLYASYGKLRQDSDNNVMSGVNGTYEQAFKVGLRHQF